MSEGWWGRARRSGEHPAFRPCTGGRDCRTDQPPGYTGRLPDAEVRAAGVVAPDRGHSAGVRADVARPGLGDVKGAVGIHAHAWDRLDVDGGSLLLPDVPERETMQAHSGCDNLLPTEFSHDQILRRESKNTF